MKGGAGKLAYRALLLGAMAISCASATQATAASRACRQLNAELASFDKGGKATPSQVRKYDSAIARQQEEMAKARSRSQSAGCGFSLFGSNVAACAALNASLDRMNRNLDTLRSQRARLAKGSSRRDRARIMASLDAHNCRGAKVAEKASPTRKNANPGLPDLPLEDDDSRFADTQQEPVETGYLAPLIDLSEENAPHPRGEFRTLCVRTCDGYFFPMSNAASLRDFERDQKNCESSCPGTHMQVFYTRGFGSDPAAMISSANGKPYSELPTAYLYKKPGETGVPACGCNAQQGFEIIGGGSSPQRQSRSESTSITSFGPMPAAPQNAAGQPYGETEKTVGQAKAAETLTSPPAGERKVRVVAPAFLPAPEAAIDLQAPDRKTAP